MMIRKGKKETKIWWSNKKEKEAGEEEGESQRMTREFEVLEYEKWVHGFKIGLSWLYFTWFHSWVHVFCFTNL